MTWIEIENARSLLELLDNKKEISKSSLGMGNRYTKLGFNYIRYESALTIGNENFVIWDTSNSLYTRTNVKVYSGKDLILSFRLSFINKKWEITGRTNVPRLIMLWKLSS